MTSEQTETPLAAFRGVPDRRSQLERWAELVQAGVEPHEAARMVRGETNTERGVR
jgi:hypothetical protein